MIEFLKAVLYGIIEGITEWLPISSTGHLILIEDLIPFAFTEDKEFLARYWEMFEVVIQMGAILAVVVLFWKTLWPFSGKKTKEENKKTWILWWKIVIASIPAGIMGLVGDRVLEKLTGKDIDGWFYNAVTVAVTLIVYGIAFLVIEKIQKNKPTGINSVEEIAPKTAFLIGCFQMLSLIPGTSRSGSTILGSITLGLSRKTAAEFSFLMGVPIMVGASGVKMLKFLLWVFEENRAVSAQAWLLLLAGAAVSFVISMVAIQFLLQFVRKHSFASFGYYRIALGVLVLIRFFLVK